MSLFTLYLIITVIPSLNILFTISTIVMVIVATITLVVGLQLVDDCDFKNKEGQFVIKAIKRTVTGLIISVLMCIATPSKEQIYTIVGGYAVTNVEGIDKLPKNMVAAANKFLEEFNTEETKDETLN